MFICEHVIRTWSLEDERGVNKTEHEKIWSQGEHDCTSDDAVAARNGLWVILRYRPYCAAAIKSEYATRLSSFASSTPLLRCLVVLS